MRRARLALKSWWARNIIDTDYSDSLTSLDIRSKGAPMV